MTVAITLRQLAYLVAVVEDCHFGRAAERRHVTQSTLSAGLKALEEQLGATLVERTRRRVLPTPLGREVAAQARRILALAEALVETAGAAAAPLSGAFRLGVIPTIGPFLLPKALAALRADYPALRLYLREDQTAALLDRLARGELEAAVIALPYDIGDCESLALGHDRLWVALPGDHPLAAAPRVRSAALPEDQLLLLEDGHCLREHALAACHLGGARHREAFQATSLHTLVEMVAGGLGITFLPEMAVAAGLGREPGIALRPLAEASPPRRIALVWRRSSRRGDDMRLLGERLRAACAALTVAP